MIGAGSRKSRSTESEDKMNRQLFQFGYKGNIEITVDGKGC